MSHAEPVEHFLRVPDGIATGGQERGSIAVLSGPIAVLSGPIAVLSGPIAALSGPIAVLSPAR